MKVIRSSLLLVLWCGAAAAGFAAAPRTVSAIHSGQATLARSLEEKAADECWAGDTVRAMQTYRDVLNQWHALDDIDGIIRCRTAIFSLLRETGTMADEAEWLRQTREIWATYQATSAAGGAKPGDEFWRSQMLLNHSILVFALESQPADLSTAGNALRDVRNGTARLPADEQRRWQIALRNLEARIHLAQGDREGAVRILQAPLPAYVELGEDRDAVREVAQSWFLAARTIQGAERWQDALAHYQAALEGFRALGQVRWIQSCLEGMSEVCRRGGQDALAQQFQLRLEAQRRSLRPADAGTGK
jgi:tetratricopeptide (TPR) repeat protein